VIKKRSSMGKTLIRNSKKQTKKPQLFQ